MAEKFDEFLNEVENDIRQEKLLMFWRRYGKAIIAAVTSVVIFVGGYNLWAYHDYNQRLKMSEKLSAATDLIDKGEKEKAVNLLNSLAQENNKAYGHLALFQKAGILLKKGEIEEKKEAIAVYHQLAGNKDMDPLWRDLAALLEIMTQMDGKEYNSEVLITQLNALTEDQNPWRYFAREMKGVLLQGQGKNSEAAEIFARLVQDNQTPSGISMRARLMTQIVSAEISE